MNSDLHIVPKISNPIRLKDYVIGIFTAIQGISSLKKVIKKQYLTVNGNQVSTDTLLFGGESIELNIPTPKESKIKPSLTLKVIFEDDYLAAIYKPAGIIVSGNKLKTIANALSQNLQMSLQNDATTPKPAHRLDYETTGILLIGKTISSIRSLNKLFEDRKIKKTYHAVTIGKMDNEGIINSNIDNKNALTQYKLVKTVYSKRFICLNLVELNPETGRRHQLRKHLAEIGNQILGDKDSGSEALILRGKGLYLNSTSLQFIHPISKINMNIETELPKKFVNIFN